MQSVCLRPTGRSCSTTIALREGTLTRKSYEPSRFNGGMQLRKILAPSKVMIHHLRRSRNSIDLAHTRPHSNPAIDVGRPTIQLMTANSRIPSITLVGRRATLPQSADLYACNIYTQGMQQRHQRNNLVQQDSFDSESEEYFMFKLSAPAT